MLCGLYPPEKCGIGDYLFEIVQELEKRKDLNIKIIANIDWSTKKIFSVIKQIRSFQPDIIHIQYPSVGYGASFVPHIVSMMFKRTIVTVHEVSDVKLLRRLSLFFFSLRATLIFTNTFELGNFKKLFPWYRKKNYIVPIGSNINFPFIPKGSYVTNRTKNEIIYFGYIRPKKGIEDVIKLANILDKNGDTKYKIVIMGRLLPMFESYHKELLNLGNPANLEWRLNLTVEEVFTNLRNATYVYLPYPDGISERRGSFLAALCSGTPMFTKKGEQTTLEMHDIVLMVNSPEVFVNILTTSNPSEYYKKINIVKIREYLDAHTWLHISNIHYNIYHDKVF